MLVQCVSVIFVAFSVLSQTTDPANTATTVFVKSGATGGNGKTFDSPVGSLKGAYDLLAETSNQMFTIKVIKGDALKAEAITFDKSTGITIEGITNADGTNEKVEIDCDAKSYCNLFECKQIVMFKYLIFDFPTTLVPYGCGLRTNAGPFALIHAVAGTENEAGSAFLRIENCDFVRPTTGEVEIHLVKVSAGSFAMDTVECTDETNTATFTETPFLVDGAARVSLASLNLRKITSSSNSVVKISSTNKIEISLDYCTFTGCVSSGTTTATSGALYVESVSADSIFWIRNTGPTTFTTCTCENGKSGGIYLKMTGIWEASRLSWPATKENLVFTGCAVGEWDSIKNTGLYLDVPVSLHEEIAAAMKRSFAADYICAFHLWFVAAKGADGNDVDFTSTYFDPQLSPPNITCVYAKNGGRGNGLTKEEPIGSLKDAYEKLAEGKTELNISVLKGSGALKAEVVTFSKARNMSIRGFSANGGYNETVAIDCNIQSEHDLFTCEHFVHFERLAFQFPATLDRNQAGSTTTDDAGFALIATGYNSECIHLERVSFVRPLFGDIPVKIHLVKATHGDIHMFNVECLDDSNCVTFAVSPFLFAGAGPLLMSSITILFLDISNFFVNNFASLIRANYVDFDIHYSNILSAQIRESGGTLLNIENSNISLSSINMIGSSNLAAGTKAAENENYEENGKEEEEHLSCQFERAAFSFKNCTTNISYVIFTNSSFGALKVVEGKTVLDDVSFVGNATDSANYISVQRNVLCERGELEIRSYIDETGRRDPDRLGEGEYLEMWMQSNQCTVRGIFDSTRDEGCHLAEEELREFPQKVYLFCRPHISGNVRSEDEEDISVHFTGRNLLPCLVSFECWGMDASNATAEKQVTRMPFWRSTFEQAEEVVVEVRKSQLLSLFGGTEMQIYVRAVLKLREDTISGEDGSGGCVVKTECVLVQNMSGSARGSGEGSAEQPKQFAWWIVVVAVGGVAIAVVAVYAILVVVQKKQRKKKRGSKEWIDIGEEDETDEKEEADEKREKQEVLKEEGRMMRNPVMEAHSERNVQPVPIYDLGATTQSVFVLKSEAEENEGNFLKNKQMNNTENEKHLKESMKQQSGRACDDEHCRSQTSKATKAVEFLKPNWENGANSFRSNLSSAALLSNENASITQHLNSMPGRLNESAVHFEQRAENEMLGDSFVEDIVRQILPSSTASCEWNEGGWQANGLAVHSAGVVAEGNILHQLSYSEMDERGMVYENVNETATRQKEKNKGKKGKRRKGKKQKHLKANDEHENEEEEEENDEMEEEEEQTTKKRKKKKKKKAKKCERTEEEEENEEEEEGNEENEMLDDL
ncbi:uncharacterized protein MONOS_2872 [Monocercomonoides exilis]|uniref:uncharacterized protein n=1 Tax=Monocercomonoides exilis TaxID=2049356 RepID=UPI003559915E|nr:hypothetical protein MONOS_2872 [Monocercomonoides exilis]|eukprot:MONOS_2872.1-p1 / transcript=MONOS_2872.1 / gene=MONOS_2872 / organism=Monocercomonoides_exilis_PA203 / gene_product=unspecified product / transcript_product=unspecified product / location=Mono_scaffold00062:94538-98542(-) / protein_length=1335 / sequence_SO=supercontig / SO=protein_coding / is_pseudo=false